jgi:hypothetical protein
MFQRNFGLKPLGMQCTSKTVHVPDARRQKLDPKAIEGIFVGCCPFKKAYRIWVESKRKIEVSRNVVVDESNNLPLPDALQSTSQSTPFDLFLPPRNMGETNEQPVETEVQTKGSAEAPMEAEEMPDKQCPPEVTFINEIREDPNNILNFQQEAQSDLPLDRPLPRRSERTPAYTQAFLDWRRSL